MVRKKPVGNSLKSWGENSKKFWEIGGGWRVGHAKKKTSECGKK